MSGKLMATMHRSFAARSRSRALLAATTRAVEIAVEESEWAAHTFLAAAREAADAPAA